MENIGWNNITTDEAARLCLEGECVTAEERRALAMERLRDLVAYAKEHSPYYSEAYRNIGDTFELQDLPTTSKGLLMADYERWVTDPMITYEGVTNYIKDPDSLGKLYLGKYTALTTSGTTGKPMPMVRDAGHNKIHGALMQTRFLRETDPDLMVPIRHKIATVIFKDPSISSYSGFLKTKLAYPDYEENMLDISLTENVDEIVRKLNEFQPELITGYPSVMGSLAKAADAGRLKIHPKAVACSAEKLKDNVYQALKDTFGCPILNNYCSTEGGEAAMACSEGKLHINDDWVIIEPVDRDGRSVPEGEWSDGILITDLTNYVQPVIRYYMGDRIRIVPQKCGCGSTLPVMEIMGRSYDNLIVGEKELFGVNIEYLLMYIKGVYSIQLVQKNAREFELRMIASQEGKEAELFEEAKEILLSFFEENGCGPIKITLSDQPPVHSHRGGKVKFIVQEKEIAGEKE